MTVLTAKRRDALPKKKFGLVQGGKEKYPMPNKAHAADAKGRAKQQLNRGKISAQDYHHIVNKANAILGQ